ncbi:putative major facilitator superfamily transporter [Kitasatospora setae KM-6054]|uniref:Putative major facilitator superfamily transporter n=1 Tax=Kitasatospora setae (strain ATCC 33774 / DSM 43861 / JCM 3304 / KCC A-0304 / NBRC 14216 / KM-6054) TaxID=452652 RepID=E4N869_KITSK|nr:putative major facilitator superfamily transporter [Kitasatospora setae KM-6054]
MRDEAAGGTAGTWRRMRMWGAAHAVDDLYQGLVPAVVPYFVLERGYGYVAAGGLTLAATLGSAVPQPLVGLLVDRRPLPWLAAAGLALAGLGAGLSGLADGYPLVWVLVLLSGLGVAAFHPAAGRAAREAAGDSAGAMSVFAAGGSVGFFLAPVLATPLLAAWGVRATAVFTLPALLMAALLFRARHRTYPHTAGAARRGGRDRWRPFAVLTGVEVVRSVVFFGVSTFIELYWLRELGASHLLAGAALTCFLLGGVAGTLGGGRLADRIGMVRTAQWGTALTVPALVLLRVAPGAWAPLLFAVLAGATLNLPFAVLVKLGQDYLPNRPGTAAGVTLGLAVSVGGLIAPLFGLIAQRHGPQGVLTLLPAVPLLGVALGAFMVEPGRWKDGDGDAEAGDPAPASAGSAAGSAAAS